MQKNSENTKPFPIFAETLTLTTCFMSASTTAPSLKAVTLKFSGGNSENSAAAPLAPAPNVDVGYEERDSGVEVGSDNTGSLSQPTGAGAKILAELVDMAETEGFSDLQIQTDRMIYANAAGSTRPITKWGKISSTVAFEILQSFYDSRRVFLGIGPQEEEVSLEERLLAERKLDFASEGGGDGSLVRNGRYRVQAHFSNIGIGVSVRVLRDKIATLEQLGMPAEVIESMRQRVSKTQGLGLIVGPTGSGKTTTLAALLDWVRRGQNKHIVTIEDPIEYVYPDTVEVGGPSVPPLPAPALVTQQEVGA